MKFLKTYEEFYYIVKYDPDIERLLKNEVGDLSKLTPYLKKYGANRVKRNATSPLGVSIYKDDKLISDYREMNDFVERALKFVPVSV